MTGVPPKTFSRWLSRGKPKALPFPPAHRYLYRRYRPLSTVQAWAREYRGQDLRAHSRAGHAIRHVLVFVAPPPWFPYTERMSGAALSARTAATWWPAIRAWARSAWQHRWILLAGRHDGDAAGVPVSPVPSGEAAGPVAIIASPRHVYQGRLVLVIKDLADLRGPVSGTVTLPLEVFWSGPEDSSRLDLGRPGRLKVMYRTVVREARSPEHLTDYLDGATLISLWPRLVLPPRVRAAWEEQHPELASVRRGHAAALRAAS